MADSGGSIDLKEEENNSSTQSEDNVKFRDPLLTGLEKDSDDDGVRKS